MVIRCYAICYRFVIVTTNKCILHTDTHYLCVMLRHLLLKKKKKKVSQNSCCL